MYLTALRNQYKAMCLFRGYSQTLLILIGIYLDKVLTNRMTVLISKSFNSIICKFIHTHEHKWFVCIIRRFNSRNTYLKHKLFMIIDKKFINVNLKFREILFYKFRTNDESSNLKRIWIVIDILWSTDSNIQFLKN